MARLRPMRTYRIPVKAHFSGAKTKAHISHGITPDGKWVLDFANATQVIEVIADTHTSAYEQLLHAFLPEDPREILGRANVGLCVLTEAPLQADTL